MSDLRSRYNAVVLAYGASSDNLLGIPGEVGRAFMGLQMHIYVYIGLHINIYWSLRLDKVVYGL